VTSDLGDLSDTPTSVGPVVARSIQMRMVILIALLALARKFIILDASKTKPMTIIGLAAAVLALGAVHWLVRDQDRKDTQLGPDGGQAPQA
jgi:uncharacterized membrane protein (DUF373 family)